jgi:8-oxo-dGTP pyrophosphatase MutT (NUDIX family)
VNLASFASQFVLKTTPEDRFPNDARFKPNAESKDAAVLVPIVQRDEQLTVLFTQRAFHMRHHPGQISFPGGRRDPEDESFIATALRESDEEIGLKSHLVKPIGWLPKFHTISNYSVYPLVGLIENIGELNINEDEVANVFEVPLNHFLTRQSHFTVRPKFNNSTHRVHFMPYQDKVIWGATAAILDKLASHFE